MDDVANASKFYDQNTHSLAGHYCLSHIRNKHGQAGMPVLTYNGTNMDRLERLSYLTRLIMSEVE